jgi:hypothetical protein
MDQNTIAKMTAALEYVCKKIPPDKDSLVSYESALATP